MASRSDHGHDSGTLSKCICHGIECSLDAFDTFHSKYRFEAERLRSFTSSEKDWPHVIPSRIDMAQAGFYFLEDEDTVKCFECCITIAIWDRKPCPWLAHVLKNPMCRYIRHSHCGNVKIGNNPEVIDPMQRTHAEVIALYGIVLRANVTSYIFHNTNLSISRVAKFDNFGYARYPQYACYLQRLRSFDTWPVTKVQRKEDMLYSGFYYTGKTDLTICYQCGIQVYNWQPKNDPLLEHIQRAPKCLHIVKKLNSSIIM